MSCCPEGGLGAVGHLDFFIDIVDVGLYGV